MFDYDVFMLFVLGFKSQDARIFENKCSVTQHNNTLNGASQPAKSMIDLLL